MFVSEESAKKIDMVVAAINPKQFGMMQWFRRRHDASDVREEYNMRDPVYAVDVPEKIPGCGTAACFAGWCALFATQSKDLNEAYHKVFDIGFCTHNDYPMLSVIVIAERWLGIQRSRRLFFVSEWPPLFKAKYIKLTKKRDYVARFELFKERVEHFKETGL